MDAGPAMPPEPPEPTEPSEPFVCCVCGLCERFEYRGREPPCARGLVLLEDCYVLEDPFGPPRQGQCLVLGTDCSACGRPVCRDARCSLFYGRTLCRPCALAAADRLPAHVRDKVLRMRR